MGRINRDTRATAPISRGVHARRFSARVSSVMTRSGVWRRRVDPSNSISIETSIRSKYPRLLPLATCFGSTLTSSAGVDTRLHAARHDYLRTPVPSTTHRTGGVLPVFDCVVRATFAACTPTHSSLLPHLFSARRQPYCPLSLASTRLSRIVRVAYRLTMAAVVCVAMASVCLVGAMAVFWAVVLGCCCGASAGVCSSRNGGCNASELTTG